MVKNKRGKAKIIIISGPSGAGKTTLLKKIFLKRNIHRSFLRSVSYTTRQKRRGERDGKDYYFVDKETFHALIRKKFFLEYQKVLNDYYGTPKYFLEEAGSQGKDLILCIDVKGGMYLERNAKRDKIATIFISAPTAVELSRRLRKRGDSAIVGKRAALAKKELQFVKVYDYLIINQNLKEALRLLEAVLIAERLRRRR